MLTQQGVRLLRFSGGTVFALARRLVGLSVVATLGMGALGTAQATAPSENFSLVPRSTASNEGVTNKQITISIIGGFTSPLGALTEQTYNGALTWQAEVNDHGGINGRKVVLKKVDNHGTPDGAVAACKEVRSNGSFGAVTIEEYGEADCLDAAGIPVIDSNLPAVNPEWHSARAILELNDMGRVQANYLHKTASKKKIGVIQSDDLLVSGQETAFSTQAKKLGLEIVGSEKVRESQSSFVPELQRLRDDGAQTVVMIATIGVLGILRDAKAIGYNAQFTGSGWCVDQLAAVAPDLFQGLSCLSTIATTDSPAYVAYKKASDKYGLKFANTTSAAFYADLKLFGEVARKAGQDLTRDAMISSFSDVQNYKTGIYGPVSWGPGVVLVGTHSLFPVKCCGPGATWEQKGSGKPSEFG